MSKGTSHNFLKDIKGRFSTPVNPVIIESAVQEYIAAHPISAIWSAISGKPLTFPPATHIHDVSEAVADYLIANPPTGYTHPANHPPSIITQDANNRFVTDSEKVLWGGKQPLLLFTPVADDDARLSDARDPKTHGHLATDIEGTAILEGDARLNDARIPVAHAHTWKSGIATKNITDASTVQNIAHGLGRVPTFVRIDGAIIITAAISQQCTGVFDGTSNRGLSFCIGEGTSTAATDAVYTSTSIALGFSPLTATNPFTGTNRQTGIITVDATNIIITWTKTGTVASLTASLLWQCT